MTVKNYELDRWVLEGLRPGATSQEQIKNWQGAASGIAEFVSSWGMERFWATSRSAQQLGGQITDVDGDAEDSNRRYFAWAVAREVLCRIVGNDLQIRADMTTQEFQTQFQRLNFNKQMLLTDLLLEIGDTIQFWTMRLKDTLEAGQQATDV
jgi:hypothetical protein